MEYSWGNGGATADPGIIRVDPTELEQTIIASAALTEQRRRDPVDRRARGQVFTPEPLARLVAEAVLAPLIQADPARPLRVLDPAAGDGRFLAAVAAVAAARALAVELHGFERDPGLAAAARARVPGATLHVVEALFEAPDLGPLDAVIGNPPYVRSIRLREADPALWARLRGAFAATAHGEWDLYGAFVERALDWVRPGGRIGLIIPSRWLTAAWATRLRGKLAGARVVREVVDFGAAQVFPDATTYASVIVMERSDGPSYIEVLRRGAAGWARSRIDGVGAAPWVTGATADGALCLGEVAHIAKGTGTNADPVFVIEAAIVEGALVRGIAAGEPVVIEAAATRACLRGRDVQDTPRDDVRCLVPYRDARLIPWTELVQAWPLAAAHLERHRPRLEARERGRFTGDRFHAFGRPQNLGFHLDPAAKVVVPDVARTPRARLDDTGALVLDTAYALRPRLGAPPPWDDPRALLALLRSPAVLAWLERAGVPLRGDYRRLKTAYLAPMPLPGTIPPCPP